LWICGCTKINCRFTTHRQPLPVEEDLRNLGKLSRAHPAPELGLVVPGQAQVPHVSLDELGPQDFLGLGAAVEGLSHDAQARRVQDKLPVLLLRVALKKKETQIKEATYLKDKCSCFSCAQN
jgi:hypothetical protein